MDIVVLAGGLSVERDVSLSSGSLVRDALKRRGHRAVLVDVFFGPGDLPENPKDFFGSSQQDDYRVSTDMPDIAAVRASRPESGYGDIGAGVIALCRAADIVYMGLHGDDGENGRMQAFLDVLGIPYTGAGYLGSALAMHKAVAKQMLMREGIPTPKSISLFSGQDTAPAYMFGYPCVVKPVGGGSSLGISIPQNKVEMEKALRDAFALEREALIEQYIEGREFSIGVLGDTVLPPVEIIPNEGFYDYAHKYQPGWTEEICPAQLDDALTKKLQEYAYRAHHALKLEVYSRGEFILDSNGEFWCLEMNTLPGMTPTSLLPQEAQAIGIDYDELCERIIALSLEKYK